MGVVLTDLAGFAADLMEWGPYVVQGALLIALAYNLWSRNIWHSVICGAACVATFILGW